MCRRRISTTLLTWMTMTSTHIYGRRYRRLSPPRPSSISWGRASSPIPSCSDWRSMNIWYLMASFFIVHQYIIWVPKILHSGFDGSITLNVVVNPVYCELLECNPDLGSEIMTMAVYGVVFCKRKQGHGLKLSSPEDIVS